MNLTSPSEAQTRNINCYRAQHFSHHYGHFQGDIHEKKNASHTSVGCTDPTLVWDQVTSNVVYNSWKTCQDALSDVVHNVTHVRRDVTYVRRYVMHVTFT